MSLEQSIEKLTAALTANTAALLASNQPQAKAPVAPKATPAAPTPPQTPAQPAEQALTYEAVAKVVSDFVKKHGRLPAVELLKPFNVQTLIPLKDKPVELAAAYAAFNDKAKIEAALAATTAAAAPK